MALGASQLFLMSLSSTSADAYWAPDRHAQVCAAPGLDKRQSALLSRGHLGLLEIGTLSDVLFPECS
jgi:hypothetical protein